MFLSFFLGGGGGYFLGGCLTSSDGHDGWFVHVKYFTEVVCK